VSAQLDIKSTLKLEYLIYILAIFSDFIAKPATDINFMSRLILDYDAWYVLYCAIYV